MQLNLILAEVFTKPKLNYQSRDIQSWASHLVQGQLLRQHLLQQPGPSTSSSASWRRPLFS